MKTSINVNKSISPEAQRILDSINEDVRQRLTERFPEIHFAPNKLPVPKQRQYIEKYLEPINFNFTPATITPSCATNSWALH